MLRKVVAAFNESPDARDGLALAGALTSMTGGEVLIASVMQDLKTANTADRPAQLLVRRRIAETRQAVAETLGEDTLIEIYPIADSSIPGALHQVVLSEGADMVTFGATHLGRLGRLAFGGAAESVLTGSPCPVAVAPHGFREIAGWRPQLIGVAYDGTAEADTALDAAEALAGLAGAALRLIAVEPSWFRHRVRLGGGGDGHALEERLDAAAERVGAAERTLLSGDPAGTLASEAHELDALVLGSRGHGPLGRVLLSSVSSALMHAPVCPLVVVPRAPSDSVPPE